MLITNIGQLVLMPAGPLCGAAMGLVPVLERAAVRIDGERIGWIGPMTDAPRVAGQLQLDARGGCVIPGLIDCHTHAVFVGSREREWVQKIQGRTYLEILQSGGGIHTTVTAVRAADEDELVRQTLPRLNRMLQWGVTTVEIKSGYGLTVADELKMLRAVQRLRAATPQELVGTYLAAHTIPTEHRDDPDEYLCQVTSADALRSIREGRLAEYCDVFCERGAFDVPSAERFLRACGAAGMRAKVHADQLSQMGASEMAGRLQAASADHLEYIDDAGMASLLRAGTVAVLLPGCSLFLNSQPPNARRLITAGLTVALATDFNPGSCRIESLPLIMSLACSTLRMTPMEALTACTANAAAALDRTATHGAMQVGHVADMVILDVPSVDAMCYELGRNCTRAVINRGRVCHDTGELTAAD